MKKEEIVKLFLEKGYQLDPTGLDFFYKNPEKIDIFFQKTKNMRLPMIISSEVVKSLMEQEIEVLKKFDSETKKETLTIEDIAKYFSKRYESLRKYLVGRLELVNLISINKIRQKTKKFSLIAMVKEKDGKFLSVEDSTGETKVYVEDEKLNQVLLDEVIGIICEKEDDVINAKRIIFPDIPLKKSVNKTEKKIYALFISDIFLDKIGEKKKELILNKIKNIDCEKLYVFALGNLSSKKEDIINFFNSLPENASKIFLRGDIDPEVEIENSFSSPAVLLKIEGIIFLICNGKIFSDYGKIWENQTPENIMLNLLKKRHLNPVFDLNKKISDEDSYIIDIIPDIFVSSNFGKPGIINYKGTTIISNGSFLSEPIYWIIDLKTRESIKMDFT